MLTNIILHSIVVVLSFYLFILFAYWWNEKLNTLYKYTCLVWLGMVLTNAGAVWLYIEKYERGDDDILQFVPYIWSLRHFFVIIPLILYAWYVTKKIYCANDQPRRRDDDL